RRPWFYFSETEADAAELDQARRTAQRGPDALEDRVPPPPFDARASVMLRDQAQFNPLAFVRGLGDVVAAKGARIFEHSKALEIDGDQATVITARGRVRAQHVIVATHAPKGVHLIQSALGPYREYAI